MVSEGVGKGKCTYGSLKKGGNVAVQWQTVGHGWLWGDKTTADDHTVHH